MINASSLPLEITTRIAEKLEYHDLQSFALTCRAWEDAAELYIYEELDLSVDNVADPDYFDNDGIYDVAEEIQKTLLDRWTRMLEAIQSRPVRAKMVRYIDFAMVFGLSDLLSTLIELTHRVLLEVSFSRIKSHDGLGNQRNNDIHEAMYAAIRKCPVLERVHTATFGLAYNWEHQLRSAARFCPNVVTLDICISDDLDEPGDMDQMTWLRFPALRHLTINHDVETPIAYLTPILRHNPDIELFEFLHDHDGFRLTNHCADAVAELRQHQSISRLVWCVKGTAFHSSRGLFDGTGFERLKWLTFDASIYSESETYLENISIPAVKNLEKIAVACRRSNWHRSIKPPGWATVAPPRGYVISSTVAQIRDCPSLTTVYFSVYGADPHPDPQKWCSKRTNGILIRTYTNGADEFVHLRRLELLKVNWKVYDDYDEETLDMCNDKDHRWVNYTSYKGYRVLDDILEQVYKSSGGCNTEWTEPGRNMSLPEKAWKALERGFKRVRKMPQ